jgi:hypothetical protein
LKSSKKFVSEIPSLRRKLIVTSRVSIIVGYSLSLTLVYDREKDLQNIEMKIMGD